MKILYSLGVRLYSLAILIASLFHSKAKKRVKGYQDTFKYLAEIKLNKKVAWFHCASLGEFEQGRPLIEKYQSLDEWEVVVSFFSPSGYEVIKKKKLVDHLFYLPPDTKSNTKKLVSFIQPEFVVFVKYEFWANLIFTLKKNNIKLYSVATLFREDQIYFKRNYSFFRSILKSFDAIFVQDQNSFDLAKSIGCDRVEITGDTRFDRVVEGVRNANRIEEVETFLNGDKAFVVGSSWEDDEKVLYDLFDSEIFDRKVILAPHEIKPKHIQKIQLKLGKDCVLFSELEATSNVQQKKYLIIDNIGMLSNLYQYGDLAYVGGAFHGALHNILEPSAFGLPVIFGPKFSKFPEGSKFIEEDIGISIQDSSSLLEAYQFFINNMQDVKNDVLNFVRENEGSTEKIFQFISQD